MSTAAARRTTFSWGYYVRVGLLVTAPGLTVAHVSDAVSTMQAAPTILAALGLDPNALQAVKVEGAAVLPYFPRQGFAVVRWPRRAGANSFAGPWCAGCP